MDTSYSSGNEKPTRAFTNAVNILRYIVIVGAGALLGYYVIEKGEQIAWYEFIAPLIMIAGFAAVLFMSMPRIIRVLTGQNEFEAVPKTASRKRARNFLIICLAALAIHVLIFLIGMIVFANFGPTAGSSDLFTAYWRSAWLKPDTDAVSYISVAENWYPTSGPEAARIVVLPMLPLLIRCLNLITRDSVVSAIIINTVACSLLAGMTYLTLLPVLKKKLSKAAAFIAILLPGAVFYCSPMAEPLFLLFTLFTFYFLQRRNYVVSGVFTALAGFTCIHGIMLLVPMLLVGVGHIIGRIRANRSGTEQLIMLLAGLFIASLGTLSYLMINYALFGDIFKFIDLGREYLHRSYRAFYDTPRYMMTYVFDVGSVSSAETASLWIPSLIALLSSVWIVAVKAKHLPAAYSVFFLACIIFIASSSWQLASMRLICALVPVIASVALCCGKRWKTILVFSLVSVSFLAYLVMYMLRWSVY